jgi:hypothetical protein
MKPHMHAHTPHSCIPQARRRSTETTVSSAPLRPSRRRAQPAAARRLRAGPTMRCACARAGPCPAWPGLAWPRWPGWAGRDGAGRDGCKQVSPPAREAVQPWPGGAPSPRAPPPHTHTFWEPSYGPCPSAPAGRAGLGTRSRMERGGRDTYSPAPLISPFRLPRTRPQPQKTPATTGWAQRKLGPRQHGRQRRPALVAAVALAWARTRVCQGSWGEGDEG